MPTVEYLQMITQLVTSGFAKTSIPAASSHALDTSTWQSVIDAPMLGWTGCGAGLGLVWLDVVQARTSPRPLTMVNPKALLSQP